MEVLGVRSWDTDLLQKTEGQIFSHVGGRTFLHEVRLQVEFVDIGQFVRKTKTISWIELELEFWL